MPISDKIQNLKLAIRDFLLGATNIYDMILYLERKKICKSNKRIYDTA
jgi:hypothetical protein